MSNTVPQSASQSAENARVELFTPGCLGTCWHGKYHYFEPWVGCEHDCDYCYARYREGVRLTIEAMGSSFAVPVPLLPREKLLPAIRERLGRGDIKVLKLSRFTDFFVPAFATDGLAAEVLQALIDSPVERIIITTKGVPDPESLEMMARNGQKISYNLVAKPVAPISLEPKVRPVEERLEAAARLNRAGILTTVHMDPIVPGFEDDEEALRRFGETLMEYGLRRVMFSLLLLSDPIIADFRRRLGDELTDKILTGYALERSRQYLPKQSETVYFEARPEIKDACVRRISRILKEMGFHFVLCGLKSVGGGVNVPAEDCPRCDGTFYA